MSILSKKKIKTKFSFDFPDELIRELRMLGKTKQISVRQFIRQALIEISNQSKTEKKSNSLYVSKN